MGIKKAARPINKAKNQFVKWLKQNDATSVSIFEGVSPSNFRYYRQVDGFIGDNFIIVYFMMWYTKIKIEYQDSENSYEFDNVEDFLELIS